jgi:NOL1/NOP2/fmu family ribosome biogenesis protein
LAEEDERNRLLGYLEERFGIPQKCFDEYLLFQQKKTWFMLKNSLFFHSAGGLKVSGVGLRAFKRVSVYIKPATRWVQIFGHLAKRAKLHINEQQFRNLLTEGSLPSDLQIENGYVILFLNNQPLGLGLLVNGTIRSQLPRRDLTFLHKNLPI